MTACFHIVHHEEDSNQDAERSIFILAGIIMSPNFQSFFCMYRKKNITIDALNNVSHILNAIAFGCSSDEKEHDGAIHGRLLIPIQIPKRNWKVKRKNIEFHFDHLNLVTRSHWLLH